ncbi:sensor histidine kinase [Ammoniphilus sp. 3BR4]|uniref:sensor histidine kinase n=1 Tax=Ammoniphilus sp. 3BR4 TaxID=3158265 RepID=UPI0034655C8E
MEVVRKNLVFLAFFLTLILAGYLVLASLDKMYIGITVDKNEKGWQVAQVDSIGWAQYNGIRKGDSILSLDLKPPDEHPSIIKYGVVENISELEWSRNGEKKRHTVSGLFLPQLMVYHIVIPGIVFMILFLLSLFLYFRKSNDPAARILILFCIILGLCYLSASASARVDPLALLLNRFTFLAVPVLFIHFIYCYFIRYGIRLLSKTVLRYVYYINAAVFVFHTPFLFMEWGSLYSLAKNTLLALFSINMFLCIYILSSSYKRINSLPALKLMLNGIAFSFSPFILLVAIPRILFGVEIIPGSVAAVFLVILPFLFIYLITTDLLFDIDFFIHRLRYYGLLALFSTSLVQVVMIPANNDWLHSLQDTLAIYFSTVIFLYIKEELDYRFSSKLFKQKHQLNVAIDHFLKKITKSMKLSEMEDQLTHEFKKVLNVKSATILEMDKSTLDVHVRKEDPESKFKDYGSIRKIFDRFSFETELVELDSEAFVKIGEKNNLVYFLFLEEKNNRTRYNKDEIFWIQTVARYISIMYENLNLVEVLTEELEGAVRSKTSPWVSRLLFSLSEKERRLLAADLHDSALQDQLLCYRQLEPLSRNNRIPTDIQSQLKNISEALLDVAHQIRETCNELRPPFIKEMGLLESLESLFEYARLRTNYSVQFDAQNFDSELNDEQALALYRIVQELLTNAAKHSKATQVSMHLYNKSNQIYFRYRDNGIGMDVERFEFSIRHMGLSGIKERVHCFDGRVELNSIPGEGLEIFLTFPNTEKVMLGGASVD